MCELISRWNARRRFSARSEPTGYSRAVLDCTYRVQIPHRLGQLAHVASAIAHAERLSRTNVSPALVVMLIKMQLTPMGA